MTFWVPDSHFIKLGFIGPAFLRFQFPLGTGSGENAGFFININKLKLVRIWLKLS